MKGNPMTRTPQCNYLGGQGMLRGSARKIFGATILRAFAMIPIALVVLAGPAIAKSYRVVDLGTLGGTTSFAFGINNRGQIVGEAAREDGVLRPVLWENGRTIDLDTLGGASGRAFDVNESGVIVGRAANAAERLRPFRLDYAKKGAMEEIPPLPGAIPGTSSTDGTGYGINASGVITGFGVNNAGLLQAFISNGASTTVVPTPGGTNSRAWDINDAGQIAGWGRDASNAIVGYRWSEAEGVTLVGNLVPGADVFAVGINNHGHVTGAIQKDFGHQTPGATAISRSFLWDGSNIVDIGLVAGFAGSAATLINDYGQIVGQAFNFDANGNPITPIAFLYDRGVNYDLNVLIPDDSGWNLTRAYDINELGQIVGQGEYQGQLRAFLLTPLLTSEAAQLREDTADAAISVHTKKSLLKELDDAIRDLERGERLLDDDELRSKHKAKEKFHSALGGVGDYERKLRKLVTSRLMAPDVAGSLLKAADQLERQIANVLRSLFDRDGFEHSAHRWKRASR
jgi:probable HAF family extracellular repeat protein